MRKQRKLTFHLTLFMRCISFLLLFILAASANANATNITVSGDVSGDWMADTVFVNSDVRVPFNQQLVIRPGCVVLFNGYYYFTVNGLLSATGNSSAFIQFKSKDSSGFYQQSVAGGWAGIIMNNGPDTSKFQYCRVQNIKGQIRLEFGHTQFKFCQFDHNRCNLFYISSAGSDIRNCVIAENEGASMITISAPLYDTIKIENNTIVNNTGSAVDYWGYVRSVCILRNNIFWNRQSSSVPEVHYQPYSVYGFDTSTLLLQNCIVRNGAQLPYYNESCFDQYPKFADTAAFDFSLQWKNYPVKDSTCSIAIDNGYYLSQYDADSTKADIGAVQFNQPDGSLFTWVRFSMDSVLGYQNNHTVHFSNLSNKPYANTLWQWDFGDGATADSLQPLHTYTRSGIFTVKLVALDPNGHKDSLVLKNAITVLPGTRVNAGAISGLWEKSKAPYYVYGDVFIPQDKKLEVREGVEVRFMGQYNLDIYGSLIARGKQDDSVRFVADDTTRMRLYMGMNIDFPDADFQRNKGWGGIHMRSDKLRSDTCWLEYCRISDVRFGNPYSGKYRGTLILHHVKTAVIRNSLFANNFTTPDNYILGSDTTFGNYQSAGIAGVGTSALIENNTFKNQYQFGPSCIYLVQADTVNVANNHFLNVTNIAAAIEYSKVYNVINNKFDSVRGLCLRLEGDDPNYSDRPFNEIKGNLFYNSARGIQASLQPNIIYGVYKIRFSNNVFKNNYSRIDVCLEVYGDSIYIVNNLFYNNGVTYEISNVGGTCLNVLLKNTKTGVVANNAFVNNWGFNSFQAIIYGDSALKVYNNIIRNKAGTELQATYFSSPAWHFANFNNARNNNVKGGYAAGAANYDVDPQFMDSTSGDFRLKKTSSCINNGYYDTAGLLLPLTDLYGDPRVDPYLNRIDVGCYEYISQRPTQLTLSNDTVQENRPPLTTIGGLTTSDPDSGDVHSYSLVSIPGVNNNNTEFVIRNDSLYSNNTFQLIQGNKKVSIRTTDPFGAYLDSTFNITVKQNSITALPNIFSPGGIVVYPNPVKDFVIVDAPNNFRGDWQIYSITGQTLLSGDFTGKKDISTALLPKGFFLLRITTRKGNSSFLMVKK